MSRRQRIMLVNPGPKHGGAGDEPDEKAGAEYKQSGRQPYETDALAHMRYARGNLIAPRNSPYLGNAAMSLVFVPAPGLGTLAVDSSWRCYYDPDEVIYWPVEALAAALEHEIWHLLRQHHLRAQEMQVDEYTGEKWNWAADAEIHSDEGLVERLSEIPGAKWLKTPKSIGLEPKQPVEYYYSEMDWADIKQRQKEQFDIDHEIIERIGIKCEDEQDCPPDWDCVNGYCLPPPCEEDDECDPGLRCVHGRCIQCLNDDECPEGYVCIDHGVCAPACDEDADCPLGMTCQDGVCRPYPDPYVEPARYPWEIWEEEDEFEENRGRRSRRRPRLRQRLERNQYGGPPLGRGPRSIRTGWPYVVQPDDEGGGGGEGEGEGEGPNLGQGRIPPKKQPPPEDWKYKVDPVSGISGSSADGLQKPHELPPTSEHVTPAEEREIVRSVARAIQGAKSQGRGVGDWVGEWADDMLAAPKVDWRDLLLHAIEDAISYQQGMLEYTYSRPSRRQSASPDVVLPGTWEPVPEVAVVLDTSGSMFTAAYSPTSSAEAEEGAHYGTLLQAALNEVGGILEDYGQDIGVQLFATDTAVGWADRVFDLEDIQLVGGGGTDMGAGLEAAYEAEDPVNVIICLTDGYTGWPAEGPESDVSVIIGIVGSTEAELADSYGTPAWADEVIMIDEE